MESEKRKSEGVDKTSDQMPKKQRFKDNPELGSLPVELLTKILAQLSTSDLLCNVARVNKQFYQLTKSPLVHLVVTAKAAADEEQGANFIKAALQMRELHITHTENFNGKCHKTFLALAHLSKLRVVKIADISRLRAGSFIALSKSVWWGDLEKFQFYFDVKEHTVDVSTEFAAAVKSLGFRGNLTELGFGYKTSVEFPRPLFDLLVGPSLNKLKRLSIYNTCNAKRINKITAARKESLEDLFFGSGDEKLKDFRRPLKCYNLKKLKIPCRFDAFHILPKLRKLTTLNLGWVNSDHKVNKKALPANSMPEMLDISLYTNFFSHPMAGENSNFPYDSDWNEHDSDNCMNICQRASGDLPVVMLARACPNLRIFWIDAGDIMIDFDTFKAVIDSCTKLEVLVWTRGDDYSPTEDVDEIVPQICENLTHLKILDLEWWDFTESSERMLLEKCPNLLALCHTHYIVVENEYSDSKRHLSLKNGVTLDQLRVGFGYSPKFDTQGAF